MKRIFVSRILSSRSLGMAIIHLGLPLPTGSCSLPENAARKHWTGRPDWRFPIWPCTTRSLPGRDCYQHTPVSSYLTLSPVTPTDRGRSTLCCTCRHPDLSECPDVIRLAALRCSDFPLARSEQAITRYASSQGTQIIAKNVEQSRF